MPISSTTSMPKKQAWGVLPPWLWFWLIIYILGLFNQSGGPLYFIRQAIFIIVLGTNGVSPLHYNLLERIMSVTEIILDTTLLFGIGSVFLPQIRATYLERKYKLTTLSTMPSITLPITLQTLEEINAFLQIYMPGAILKYAIEPRLKEYAFVYSPGHRGIAVAVSSQFSAYWRNNQQAAEAILLHEIAHWRHGDAPIIGAGSLITTVVDHWLLLNVIFGLFPLIIDMIMQDISLFQGELAFHVPLSTVIADTIHIAVSVNLPFMFLLFFQSLFWTASLFILFVAAIWCAEFNADRFVVDMTHSTDALGQSMKQHKSSSRWNWLLSGISHPPQKMRRWMVLHSIDTPWLIVLLLLFPIAYFAKLLFQLGWTLSTTLPSLYAGHHLNEIAGQLGIDALYTLEDWVPSWIAMAILFAVWPFVTRYWEWLFSRIKGEPGRLTTSAYFACAGIIASVCIVGFILGTLPFNDSAAAQGKSSTMMSSSTQYYKVGDEVNVGNTWKITVDNVYVNPSSDILTPNSGNKFVVFDVSLKNVSSQTYPLYSAIQFHLQDLEGKIYQETPLVGRVKEPEMDTPTHDGNIGTGISVQGQIAYEVPVSIHLFRLSFQADRYSLVPAPSQLVMWNIDTSRPTSFSEN